MRKSEENTTNLATMRFVLEAHLQVESILLTFFEMYLAEVEEVVALEAFLMTFLGVLLPPKMADEDPTCESVYPYLWSKHRLGWKRKLNTITMIYAQDAKEQVLPLVLGKSCALHAVESDKLLLIRDSSAFAGHVQLAKALE